MRDVRDVAPHPLAGRPGLPRNVCNALVEAAAAAPALRLRHPAAPAMPDPAASGPAVPLLIAVLRDEAAGVADFLAHYRRLGVTRFALVDNGSADATPRLLAAEPDVDLWSVARPFQGKQGWIMALIGHYGLDRWYLQVDADERLVFDGMEQGRGIADLVRLAEARGLRRLRGMLVDMYAPGPLLPQKSGPEESGPEKSGPEAAALADRFPLFDGAGYDETLVLGRISRKGGPRRRCFPGVDPELTKYPLFHIREGEVTACPHQLYPYPDNYASDCWLGLLHYKFGADFREKAERARAEGNYWAESREYVRYLEALAADPGLSLAHPGSRRYTGPAALVAAGLIARLPWAGVARPKLSALARRLIAAAWRTRPAGPVRTSAPASSGRVPPAGHCRHSAG